MATIQVRNVPEDVHRTYRERAAIRGMSLQEYLLEQLIENARLKSPAEIAAEVQAEIDADPAGFATTSATEIIRELREES